MAKVLYGDCVAARDSAPVRISDLAGAGCELETMASSKPIEGDVALWIGAIGPIAATATRRDDRSPTARDRAHVSLRFKEPLNREILYHFAFG